MAIWPISAPRLKDFPWAASCKGRLQVQSMPHASWPGFWFNRFQSRSPATRFVTSGPCLRRICMKRSRLYGIATAVVALLPLSGGAFAAQNEAAKPGEEVSFPASCAADSQKALDQAVWTLHSFWYPEALSGFTNIAKADPGCVMAYWGIAMSHWYPLWYPPSAAALKAGSEAVEKALAASPKTEREKDYIGAIAAFYRDSDKLDHQTRALAYEKAMEQVYLRYPNDREAGVFYALALNATASPTDKTFANKKKAAEILNKVFAEQQNHPGVAHYLIHSDDTQELAEAGLPAAM